MWVPICLSWEGSSSTWAKQMLLDGVSLGLRKKVCVRTGDVSDVCHRVWAREKVGSGGPANLPGHCSHLYSSFSMQMVYPHGGTGEWDSASLAQLTTPEEGGLPCHRSPPNPIQHKVEPGPSSHVRSRAGNVGEKQDVHILALLPNLMTFCLNLCDSLLSVPLGAWPCCGSWSKRNLTSSWTLPGAWMRWLQLSIPSPC